MIGLSICIPVHNFNCIESVKALCEQIENLTTKAEIIVIDDASSIALNELENFDNPNYSFEKLSKNLGRAKIRNLLGKKAKFSHLLFIDGDSGIPENFLKTYIETIKKHPEAVICGGRLHKLIANSKKCLRYHYGVKYEDSKALDRQKEPYNGFMTNNFIVTKNILVRIPFNETINTYGHEDTFFGFELETNGISIIHIDNPVTHLELESNNIFIKKTKQAIENLVFLKNQYPSFNSHSTLLKKANRFYFLKPIAPILSKGFAFLANTTQSVYSFQVFKLFYMISINNQK
ncbi:glycosyltransferase family 2 protein [Algibacter sp.]|uniref:glycosyltransferase family 2 protein n=1 Tax=Algibacter sp. TaxID=1872428 RepID=UPI003C71B917